ncbi:MAG: potassium channel protein [Methanomassiliicoccales archaeon]|nr:MAG: potassium channel protein [Methanomassiliicoccales archaeon]
MIFIKVPKMVRATYKGILLLVALASGSSILFFLFEGQSIKTSLYWAAITMTTVGYGDVPIQSDGGKIVSVVLACFGILLYGYLGAMIMAIVMESSLSGVFGMNKVKYKDHFVICGWTSLSDVVLSELVTEKRQVAVITEEQDDIIIIKRMGDPKYVFPIYGDPSKSDILEQANIHEASVVILCMADDSKNLITALHIKELNPRARIIVRTTRAELKKTMKIAGVTYVVTPDVMAGRLIASAAFEPEVANFIEDVTSATDVGGFDLQQYTITQDRAATVGALSKSLREKTKTTLVAIGRKRIKEGSLEERWEVIPNPDDEVKVQPGNIVILLGNDEQFKKVKDFLGTKQGR